MPERRRDAHRKAPAAGEYDRDAEVQQRIASAVRSVERSAAEQLGHVIVEDVNHLTVRASVLATLAAAVHNDRIWDALAQLRQVEILERKEVRT